jgi:hypothetical protein
MTPQYRYSTATLAPAGARLAIDTDATSGVYASVYGSPAGGGAIDQAQAALTADRADGRIPNLWGDAATVYVRQLDYRGRRVAGVIATISGVAASGPVKTPSWAPYEYDLREFATDAAPLFNADASPANVSAVIIAAIAELGSYTRPRTLRLPNGTYVATQSGTDVAHSANYGVQWQSKLSLVGESRDGCVIASDAGSTPFYAAYGSTLTDIEFGNLTIDCTAQVAGAYTTQLKAIFAQDIQRFHAHGLRIIGSWATSIGCDALVDYLMHDILITNPGRGITALGIDPATVSGGSGIGVGTGKYQDEAGIIHDVIVRGAGRCGLFYEKQSAYTYYSRGHVAHHVKAIGCWAGLHDAGCDGLDAEINATDGVYGLLLDQSSLSPNAGYNGHVRLTSKRNSGGDVALGKVSANAFQIIDGPYQVSGSGRSGPGQSRVNFLSTYSANANAAAVKLDPDSTAIEPTAAPADLYADAFGSAAALSGATAADGSSSTAWALADGGSGGVLTKASGTVKATAGTGTILGLLTTGQSDGSCHVTLTARHATDTSVVAGIAVRAVDANNYLQVSTRQSSSVAGYTVVARVAGAGTNLITTTKIPQAGDLIRSRASSCRCTSTASCSAPGCATRPRSATAW